LFRPKRSECLLQWRQRLEAAPKGEAQDFAWISSTTMLSPLLFQCCSVSFFDSQSSARIFDLRVTVELAEVNFYTSLLNMMLIWKRGQVIAMVLKIPDLLSWSSNHSKRQNLSDVSFLSCS
jgi:hypothetical protein